MQVNCKDNETLAETFSDRITEVLSVIADLEAVKLGMYSLLIVMVYNFAFTDFPNVSNIVVPQMLSFEEQYYQRSPMILITTEETRYWLV